MERSASEARLGSRTASLDELGEGQGGHIEAAVRNVDELRPKLDSAERVLKRSAWLRLSRLVMLSIITASLVLPLYGIARLLVILL